MNDLDPIELLASSAPRLSDHTKQAHLALLRAEIAGDQAPAETSTPARRRWRYRAAAVTTACLLGLGAGTAVAYVELTKPTVPDLARCFAVNDPADFEDFDKAGQAFIDVALADAADGHGLRSAQTAGHATVLCAQSWRTGSLNAFAPHLRDVDPDDFNAGGPEPADHPVPRLVACVIPAGIVGVFPDTTCAELRLPQADLTEGRLVTSASELLGLWRTIELDGQDVSDATGVNGQQLIARFGDDQGGPWWGASDGCNETRGRFTITPAGRFSAEASATTQVGCVSEYYPRNPAVVLAADEARIMDATGTEPRRLSLLSDGKVVAVYVFQSDTTSP